MNFQTLKSGFAPTFWVANTLELFERLAFYGAKAVLAKYIAEKVGLVEDAGKLTGLFSALIFALPILAGVIVDRYGFRKTLIACFALFCIGYFMIGFAGLEAGQSIVSAVGKKTYMLSVLILTAIGGSLIKPCIVGTVSKTSKDDVKALGFSIYYSLVNLGGAMGPIVALYVREGLGIEYVLVMSSLVSFGLCIAALIFFKEPTKNGESQDARTFAQVFADMALVFTNFRFMLFLIIFSGFWLMFWQIYFLLPFYGTDVLNFEKFELLETIDAIGIIVLTIPMTALAAKLKPITAMSIGFVIASACWFIMGASLTTTATIVGIGLFAMGEATQAPRFYDYVSRLAPPNQVGTFMGFAFLPVAIGSFSAGYISDWLRLNYLHSNPSLMWYIVGGIGIASTILMIAYNFLFTPKSAAASVE